MLHTRLRTHHDVVYPGNGYLANVTPSDFASMYEEELPMSISGKEWLAAHDEHWDSATQVLCLHFSSCLDVFLTARRSAFKSLLIKSFKSLLITEVCNSLGYNGSHLFTKRHGYAIAV